MYSMFHVDKNECLCRLVMYTRRVHDGVVSKANLHPTFESFYTICVSAHVNMSDSSNYTYTFIYKERGREGE